MEFYLFIPGSLLLKVVATIAFAALAATRRK